MKSYFKLFVVAFFSFILIFAGVYFAVEAIYGSDKEGEGFLSNKPPKKEVDLEEKVEADLSSLESAIRTSGRINVIAFGLNDTLSDTMMLVSFDPYTPTIDILSVPRDTYHYVPGFDHPAQKKMNAVYGFGGEYGGPEGLKNYLSEFLGLPIDGYVRVDMDAVVSVVDTLGGYDVEVPYDMKYSDRAGNFYVDLKQGYQNLDGNQTLGFLRFRKNNAGTIQDGDVVRIPRHQDFVKAMISKAIGKNLPAVLNTIISSEYVKTDMTLEETLTYGLKAATLKTEDIKAYTLEGEAKFMDGASYWMHDPEKLRSTLEKIYHVVGSQVTPVESGDATTETPATEGGTQSGNSN